MLDKVNYPVTPATNPELWYKYYEIVKQDAPEILDTFIENTAAKMELGDLGYIYKVAYVM